MALPNVTAAALRVFARWPEGVPDEFLSNHLDAATRDVGFSLFGPSRVGQVPEGYEGDAAEAITALAAALALPFVHQFTLDGAAAAVRSVQLTANKPHFLNADSQGANIARLKDRASELTARIRAAMPAEAAPDIVAAGDIWMGAL